MSRNHKHPDAPRTVMRIDNAGWAREMADPAAAEFPESQAEETMKLAKFRIGEVVRHKHFPFRGVVFDVDP
eukprot:gene13411-16401_t